MNKMEKQMLNEMTTLAIRKSTLIELRRLETNRWEKHEDIILRLISSHNPNNTTNKQTSKREKQE